MAALGSSPSTSVASKYPYALTLQQVALFEGKPLKPPLLYNLSDLHSELGYSPPDNLSESSGSCVQSEMCCLNLLKKIHDDKGLPPCDFHHQKRIPHLLESSLPDLICSRQQIPDISFSLKGDIIPESFIEVHSGDFRDTINKALLVATDLLRLRRMFDINRKEITAFAFPKLPTYRGSTPTKHNKQCVVQVVVTWKDLKFQFKEKEFSEAGEVKEAIVSVIQKFQQLDHANECKARVIIRLSAAELQLFGQSATQYPSRQAVLVKAGGHFYKSPVSTLEMSTLQTTVLVIEKVALLQAQRLCASPVIHLEECSVLATDQSLRYYKYPCVSYDPLHVEQAKRCLSRFFFEVLEALNFLHQDYNLAHMDVRLENICFNENFKPVLIDLDRAVPAALKTLRFAFCESCMYDALLTGEQHDWLQLGWLVTWVLTFSEVLYRDEGYHTQSFEKLPEILQENDILRKLILERK